MMDISQIFRSADILGFSQAIKGFDKSDFCEVFNVSVFHMVNMKTALRLFYYSIPDVEILKTVISILLNRGSDIQPLL
jgi:hypothetical protein